MSDVTDKLDSAVSDLQAVSSELKAEAPSVADQLLASAVQTLKDAGYNVETPEEVSAAAAAAAAAENPAPAADPNAPSQ